MIGPSREDLAWLNRVGLTAEISYRCKKCGARYSQDKEHEAIVHAAIPLSHEPLPRGVVYRLKNLDLDATSLEITDAPQIYEHDHTVLAVSRSLDDLNPTAKDNRGSWEMDDTILRFQGKSPMNVRYDLLSEAEFAKLLREKPTIQEDVKRLWGIPQVLRTHPAIEAIIFAGAGVF